MNAKDVLKLVGGSVVVYFVMAACGAGSGKPGATEDDGGSSSGGAGDGSGSILDALTDPVAEAAADTNQSGTRLKVQYYAGADGSRQAAGMYDSQLKVQCYFGTASDGKTRCLPFPPTNSVIATTESYYADASCTQLLGLTTNPCSAAPTVISETNTTNCSNTTTNYQPGSQFTGTLYQQSSGTCSMVPAATQSAFMADGFKFYLLGPQIQPPDPTQYVEATLQTSP